MICPKCKGKVKKMNTANSYENEVYRLKKCEVCGYSFFTIEYEIEDTPQVREEYNHLSYLKKHGRGLK